MNRLAPLVAAALITTAVASAQATDTGVGMTLDYTEVMMFYQTAGGDVTDHYDAVGASGVLDFPYLRLTAGYAANVGNYIRFEDGTEGQDDGYRISYLNLTAVGKVPFRLADGALTLWPAAGLRGACNVAYSYSGTQGKDVNHEPHDLMLVAGAGLDYALSPSFALTSSLLFAYDLTPSMGAGTADAQAISLGLGLGMLLTL